MFRRKVRYNEENYRNGVGGMRSRNRIVEIAVACALWLGQGDARAASQTPAGVVKLIKGDVIILDANAKLVADTTGKLARKLEMGSPFYVGETVETKADGRVKLEFVEGGADGKNQVTLGTGTSLLVEKAATDPLRDKGTTLSLARGEVRSMVNKKYSGKGSDVYEVKTPNAVAGVRGTIFLARFNPQTQRSDIATERGAVAVRSAGVAREVVVQPGMFTSSAPGVAPTAPAPISSNVEISGAVKSMSSSSGDSGAGGGDDGKSASGDKGDGKKDDAKKDDAKKDDAKKDDAKKDGAKKEGATVAGGEGDKDSSGASGDNGKGDSTKKDGAAANGDSKKEGTGSTAANGDAKKDSPGGAGGDKNDGGPVASGGGDAKKDGAAPGGGGTSGASAGDAKKDGSAGAGPGSSSTAGGSSTAGSTTAKGDSSAVPLGREPVVAASSGDGRTPASSGPAVSAVPAVKKVAIVPNPSPVAEIAAATINRTATTVNTVNQTVNQTQQQTKTREARAIIRIQ
jgi:hypothetical protein